MPRPLSLEKILNRVTGRNMKIDLYYCDYEIWGVVRRYSRRTHEGQQGWLLQIDWNGPSQFFLTADQQVELSDRPTKFQVGEERKEIEAHCKAQALSSGMDTVPVLLHFAVSRSADESDFGFTE